jgi:D-alanyl-D-alanine endopeptidase (penicillin-binding protein 7)
VNFISGGALLNKCMKILTIFLLLFSLNAGATSAALYNFTDAKIEAAVREDQVVPIASITKLFTAMAIIDSASDLNELIVVKGASTGRFPNKTKVPRIELIKAMLIASDNRAADSLAHAHPGGYIAFIKFVNDQIGHIGLKNTHIEDASGLGAGNVSTASDLVNFVWWLRRYTLITQISSSESEQVEFDNHKNKPVKLQVRNTNPDIANYNVLISKTGFTSKAGRCLVMLVEHNDKLFAVAVLGEQSSKIRSQSIKNLIYNKEYNDKPVSRPGKVYAGLRPGR